MGRDRREADGNKTLAPAALHDFHSPAGGRVLGSAILLRARCPSPRNFMSRASLLYMRTDSVNISKEILPAILTEVESKFGKEYVEPRVFVTKSKNAQEAHEAVRPTQIKKERPGIPRNRNASMRLSGNAPSQRKWRMQNSSVTTVTANVGIEDILPDFTASGSIVLFPGWLAGDPRSRMKKEKCSKS